MKRVLVLSNEAARHPFRQRLPRHIFSENPLAVRAARESRDDQDWKLFLLSFAAFFTVAYTFIL